MMSTNMNVRKTKAKHLPADVRFFSDKDILILKRRKRNEKKRRGRR
jgi:hypothetical protein